MLPLIVVTLLILLATEQLQAAHPSYGSDHKVHYVGAMPDSVSMTQALLDNSPQEFRSSGLPRFVLVGPSGNFGIGVGGYAKLTGSYDVGNVISNPNCFNTSEIPIPYESTEPGKFQFGYETSRLYVNCVCTPDNGRNVGAFVSVNFLGDGWMPNLHYAYVRLGGIQLGYDYSLFSDMGAMPPTIDYLGPNASTAVHCASIRYVSRFGKNKRCKMGAALEFTMPKFTVSSTTADPYQRAPSLPLFFQYNWRPGSWIRSAAMLRLIQYQDLVESRDIYKFGWGVAVSGTAKLGNSPLRLYWQAAGGKGISTAFQDLADSPVDMFPAPEQEGRLNEVGCVGTYFGAQWYITRKLFLSATYSHLRLFSDSYPSTEPAAEGVIQTPFADQYRYADYVATNFCYEATSWLRVGVGYDYGLRCNMNGSNGHVSRFQAMLKVYF